MIINHPNPILPPHPFSLTLGTEVGGTPPQFYSFN
jgi:hypothetical protein